MEHLTLENVVFFLLALSFAVFLFLIAHRIKQINVAKRQFPKQRLKIDEMFGKVRSKMQRVEKEVLIYGNLDKPPYGELSKKISRGVKKIREAYPVHERLYQKMLSEVPQESSNKKNDSRWISVDEQGRNLLEKLQENVKSTDEVEQWITEAKSLPNVELGHTRKCKYAYGIICKKITDFASIKLTGNDVSNMLKAKDNIEKKFTEIPSCFMQDVLDSNLNASELINKTIQAYVILREVDDWISSAEVALMAWEGKYTDLDCLIKKVFGSLDELKNLLNQSQSKLIPLEENDSKINLLEKRINELALELKPLDVSKSMILENNIKAAAAEIGKEKKILEEWMRESDAYQKTHENLTIQFNKTKDSIKSSEKIILWQDAKKQIVNLYKKYSSLPPIRNQIDRSKLLIALKEARAIENELKGIHTRVEAIQEKAENSLTLWNTLRSYFVGDSYKNIEKLSQQTQIFHSDEWDKDLEVDKLPALVTESKRIFAGLGLQTPIAEQDVEKIWSNLDGLNKKVEKNESLAKRIGTQLKAAEQKKEELKQYLEKNVEIVAALSTKLSALAKNGEEELTREFQQLKAFFADLDKKDEALSKKEQKIKNWEQRTLKLLKQRIQRLFDETKSQEKSLKKLLAELDLLCSNLTDQIVIDAKNIAFVEDLDLSRYKDFSGDYLRDFINLYYKEYFLLDQTKISLLHVERTLSRISTPYQDFLKLEKDIEKELDKLKSRISREWPPCQIQVNGIKRQWDYIQDDKGRISKERISIWRAVELYRSLANNSNDLLEQIRKKINNDDLEVDAIVTDIKRQISLYPNADNFFKSKYDDIKEKYALEIKKIHPPLNDVQLKDNHLTAAETAIKSINEHFSRGTVIQYNPITTGDVFGSIFSHNSGDITNVINQRIQNSFNKVEKSNIQPELRETLKELTKAVAEMNKELAAEQASEAADDLEKLIEEAVKSKPNKKWYSVSIEGLIKAAENLDKLGTPVISLSRKVLSLLAGGW